jgi:hypothetical protein
MKRYIEIVYDNSGSMEGSIAGKPKYEIAQELFEKEILPTIALRGDEVVLRLLRGGCEGSSSVGESLTTQFGTNRKAMLSRIRSIQHDQSTPLFYTVSDAIEACRQQIADEYFIFVLTDGDDTCGVRIEDLVDQDTLDKYVKFYNVLLVQLAIDSAISSNNLTAFASYLGGRTVQLDGKESVLEMRGKMKQALVTSGLSRKRPLPHCFSSRPGFDLSWDEIETGGIQLHQALVLYEKGWLSWQPDQNRQVTTLELAELKFLFGISFISGLPDTLVASMLAQLKKPYYYSHDCIFWDFSTARWRYFQAQNQLRQQENPHARGEDRDLDETEKLRESHFQHFTEHMVYLVEYGNTIATSFVLQPIGITDYTNVLKPGDQVVFREK